MAYSFKKPKTGNRPIHIILTCLAAIIAIAILLTWLMISYLENKPAKEPDDADPTTTYAESISDPATALVMLNMGERHHFLLVQTVPAEDRVILASVPNNLDTGSSDTLAKLLNRSGPVKVMQAVANQLHLPIDHYICLTPSGVNKFISELDKGISVKLAEKITYTDENGISSSLSAGSVNLTAGQATAVLSHNGWKKPQNADLMATRIIAALINQYMTSEYSLRGYFGVLANVAQTDLRIDNFTAYASALEQLAENNNGKLCTTTTLDGTIEDGRIVPNIEACRKNTGLYH